MSFGDESNIRSNPNPKLYANCLSRLLFSWLFPLFTHAKHHDLRTNDLYDLLSEDRSEKLGDKLERCWKTEVLDAGKHDKRPRFFRAIGKALGWSYKKYGVHVFVLNVFVRVAQPIILERLISYFDSTNTWTSCKYALVLVALSILQVFLAHHASYGLKIIGMRLRIACSSLIYRKMTRLSRQSTRKISSGSVVDLLSKDVARFDTIFVTLHDVWVVPLQSVAMAYMMWERIGVVMYFGVAFMFVTTVPIQYLLDLLASKLRTKITESTDKRIILTSELLNGIRAVKMYVWEKPLENLVSSLRRKEMNIVKLCTQLRGMSIISPMFTNQITLFFILLVYVLRGNSIDAASVYIVAYYLYYLRIGLTCRLPKAINSLIEARNSVYRIQEFLLFDELTRSLKTIDESTKGTVSIDNVNAKWSKMSIANTLHDVDLRVVSKKLYVVTGPRGSGKSSLLKLILGELAPTDGEVSVSGRVSYASQESWMFDGSVRDNIVFGEEFDEARYRQVSRICDIEFGTEPTARINLARAVYRDADVYLLDDPLSNFEALEGKQLFENCVNGLLRDKTRVLVTNEVQYLKRADVVVFVNNGQIEFQGSFRDFARNERLFRLLPVYAKVGSDDGSIVNDYSMGIRNFMDEDVEEESQESEKLVDRKMVGQSTFWRYFRGSGSWVLVLSTIVGFLLAQTFLGGSTLWIARWTQNTDIENPQILWIVGSLTFLGFLASLAANILVAKTCSRANEMIHETTLTRVVGAPMRFFEDNSVEKIVDRFSKDLVTMDETIPVMILRTVQWCSIAIGCAVLVVIVNWTMLFPLVLVMFLWKKVADVYVATATGLRRLEAAAKTPILTHATNSLSGLSTIRSRNAEPRLRREFDSHQDNHTSSNFLATASSIAFAFWIDVISLLFFVFVTFGCILAKNFTASYVGLVVTQVVVLCDSVRSFVKNYVECATHRTTLERILQLADIEQEVNAEVEKPPIFWPERAQIAFENVSLNYSGEMVLRNVSFSVKAGAKIGVVGHIGSGKSSLVTALFRLAEIDGSIFIDDVDIRKIDLVRLREKISIVPQDPVIFTTTVRRNLDAYHRFDDSLLWSVLEIVELKPIISSLDTILNRGGSSLSIGQRRLLCLARTILEGNRILVMDEATTSVDAVTDETMKRVVRRHFKDNTVISIARKLNSAVLENDRVMVMNEGRLVEYDKPSVLLERKDGYLGRMVERSGREMDERMRRIGEQAGDEDKRE